jgi:hypothetical protein
MSKIEQPKSMRIHVCLADFKWTWRRFIVPCRCDLLQLHSTLQRGFGRSIELDNVCTFVVGGLTYHHPNIETIDGSARIFDPSSVRLGDFAIFGIKQKLYYTTTQEQPSDIEKLPGAEIDDWLYIITLEGVTTDNPGGLYACCIACKGNNPPAFVEGPRAYHKFLQEVTDTNHPQHASALAKCNGKFDPKACKLSEINAAMQWGHPWDITNDP